MARHQVDDNPLATGPAKIFALPRSQALALKEANSGDKFLFIDSLDGAPREMQRFQHFNPFHTFASPIIPVPGTSRYSCSIEAIWQGLKFVDGVTCMEMFEATPCKRPTDQKRIEIKYDYAAAKFSYEKKRISLLEARFLIYATAYLYLLDNLVPGPIITEIFTALSEGRHVVFYDWDSNMDISDVSCSFSHSAILRSWFSGELESDILVPAWQSLTPKNFDIFRRSFSLNSNRYQHLHLRMAAS